MLTSLALATPNDLTVGDPEGLSLRPGLLVDVRGGHGFGGAPVPLFGLQRVRPTMRGTLLGDRASYVLQAEMVPEPQLLDAVIDVRVMRGLRVQAGRFLLPFSRTQLTPVPKLLFHGFSPSANAVRGGRDVGVQLRSKMGPVDLRAGAFQGPSPLEDGGAAPQGVAHLGVDLVGAVAYDETGAANRPSKDPGLAVGTSVATGPTRRLRDDRVWNAQTVGADTAATLGPARLQAEVFLRAWADGARDLGGYAQASVSPIERTELAARIDRQVTDPGGVWTVQGLASWYQDGNHLRLSLQYELLQADGEAPAHTIALQQQLWF